MMAAIGGHHARRRGATSDDWITPRCIIDALGPFDLDPCASATQPWQWHEAIGRTQGNTEKAEVLLVWNAKQDKPLFT